MIEREIMLGGKKKKSEKWRTRKQKWKECDYKDITILYHSFPISNDSFNYFLFLFFNYYYYSLIIF